MIKRSFSEHATQQLLPEHEKAVKLSEADLAKVKRESCNICDSSLDECHDAAQNLRKLTQELHIGMLETPIGRRLFTARRLIVYNKDGVRTPGIILRDGTSGGTNPMVQVCEIRTKRESRDSTDLLPYLPKYRRMFTKLPQNKKHIGIKTLQIPVADIECLTGTITKDIVPEVFRGGEGYEVAKEKMFRLCSNWEQDEWNEMDWSKIRELKLREILTKRIQESVKAQKSDSLKCPNFLKHVS